MPVIYHTQNDLKRMQFFVFFLFFAKKEPKEIKAPVANLVQHVDNTPKY